MKKLILLLFLAPVLTSGQTSLTPQSNLGLQSMNVEVPQKFTSAFPSGKTLNIPSNYKVRVFYAGGLNKPRFMAFSPGGVLHVSDMDTGGNGKVYAFPDLNADGIADTAIAVVSGFTNNHDIKFYKGNLYVTETTRIWKCTDSNQDGIYENKTVFIDNIGGGGTTGHVTRTIVFDSAHQKMYLSIGSSCNVCRESDRAIIEQYNDDGTGKRTFATGVRNAVGMTLHPVTGRLWAANNGSDRQGNEIPPEWIDVVRDGGFYGHPFAYGNQEWFNFDAHSDYQALKPITQADSAKVSTMVEPAAQVRAHSAPMAIMFLNESFPIAYRKGFLLALRGSWNTTDPNAFRGYKVIYGNLGDAVDTTVDYVGDFCSGFITDTVNRIYWGRPVGLAADRNGNVFMSSDEGNKFILVMSPTGSTGIKEQDHPGARIGKAYPNPSVASFTLPFSLDKKCPVKIALYDMLGRQVRLVTDKEMSSGSYTETIEWDELPGGMYLLKVSAGNTTSTQKIYCDKE